MTNVKFEVELGKMNVENKVFSLDYQSELSTIFLAFRNLENDLKKESDSELSNELGRLDRMSLDINHIIEIVDFNASRGYKLAKMQQVVLRNRRKIKDRIEERRIAKSLLKVYKSEMKGTLNNSIKNTEYVTSDRSYRFRELHEVEGFEEVINGYKGNFKIQ